jgi:hypothetical protein
VPRCAAEASPAPRNARACTAPDARQPRFAALTTHPAPAIVLSRVNLNAQGGLDFRLATTGYQERGGEQIPASLIEARAFGTPVLGEWSTLTGLPSRGGLIPLDNAGKRRRSDALGLELRSLVGIMFFLSHAVDVPQRDIDAGRVAVTRTASGEPFDWEFVVGDLLDIKSQDGPPANATIAVQYRDTWFYIDDADTESKYTFMLVQQLSALQAGNIEHAGPVLTLPIGSR